jgi:two-component system LytT family response regulator
MRAVVVDDEPPARRKLLHLLTNEADFTAAGEAGSAREALEVLSRTRPDVVFLDIQLPDASGFDVISALEPAACPHVVFVTAYDDFALKAFEVHAIDYLLKPVEPSRFSATLQRVRSLGDRSLPRRMDDFMAGLKAPQQHVRRLLIQEQGRSIFLEVSQIDWVEAARNYACIHSGAHTHILRSSLDSLATKLDPGKFRRITRSEIVNVDRIVEVRPASHGDQRVRLRDGTELTWSRRYRTGSLEDLQAF